MSERLVSCPKCGAPIKESASEGLCPRCLLRGAIRSGRGSASPTDNPPGAERSEATPPLGRLGDYELLEMIAQGGMGAVYEARQISLNRLVALKLILAGRLATEQEIRRFHTEAEAAAHLDHPNIVPIFEVGEQEGRHFYVMKLVQGGSLAERMRKAGCRTANEAGQPAGTIALDPRRSAMVMTQVARAVHHAHERGILHRDLKPANILLDTQGQPHVTDFGLARLLEHDSGLTLPGAVVGTPSFMAPEQAAGRAKELTTAADIYSLGAIFYFLLTGRPPFEGATGAETIRRVLDEEPQRPRTLAPETDRDLETICLKCLEKDPFRRYSSALALAEDLERWLRHEPIHARPATFREQVLKWGRRRPALAALMAVSALSIAGFVGLLAMTGVRLKEERNRALKQEEATRQSLYAADVYLAQKALVTGNLGLARRALEAHRPQIGGKDLRGFEWRYLWSLCQGDQIATLHGHTAGASCVCFSQDGRLLASGGDDKTVRVWDAATRQPRLTFDRLSDAVVAVAFSPDGQRLMAGTADGTVSVWEIKTQSLIVTCREDFAQITLAPAATIAAFSQIVYPKTGREAVVKFRDLRTGAALGTLRYAGGRVAISHDGRDVVTTSQSGFKLWDMIEWRERSAVSSAEPLSSFLFSRDDRLLAGFVDGGQGVKVWQTASEALAGQFRVPEAKLHGGDFSPDGRWLATCGTDQSIHVWDLASGQKLAELKGHVNEVRAVVFSPDGRWLASASKDGTVRLWNAAISRPVEFPTNAFPLCALSGNGRWLATQDRLGRGTNVNLVLWDTATWQATALPNSKGAQPVAFVDGDNTLLTMGRPIPGKVLWLGFYDMTTRTNRAYLSLPDSDRPRTALDYSPRGNLFALGSYDGQIPVWQVSDGRLLTTLRGPSNEVQMIRFSPDGRTLASFTRNVGVKLWDIAEGRARLNLTLAAARAHDLAFSADGELLAAADSNNAIDLWNSITGEQMATFAGHAEPVMRLAFSPEGRTLASASEDGTVKLWSLAARRELATLFRGGALAHLEFTPDGQTLLGTGTNGHLHCWRAPADK